jgi:hypothetical protein
LGRNGHGQPLGTTNTSLQNRYARRLGGHIEEWAVVASWGRPARAE